MESCWCIHRYQNSPKKIAYKPWLQFKFSSLHRAKIIQVLKVVYEEGNCSNPIPSYFTPGTQLCFSLDKATVHGRYQHTLIIALPCLSLHCHLPPSWWHSGCGPDPRLLHPWSEAGPQTSISRTWPHPPETLQALLHCKSTHTHTHTHQQKNYNKMSGRSGTDLMKQVFSVRRSVSRKS